MTRRNILIFISLLFIIITYFTLSSNYELKHLKERQEKILKQQQELDATLQQINTLNADIDAKAFKFED